MDFGLSKETKAKIESVLLQYPFKYYAFGSRSTGKYRTNSDLDLVLFGDIAISEYAKIKTELEDLLIPLSIDIVAWKFIDEEFRTRIKPELKPFIKDVFLNKELIDLTHYIDTNIPTFNENDIVKIEEHKLDNFCLHTLNIPAGIGTHIDLPRHLSNSNPKLFINSDFCAPVNILNLETSLITKEHLINYENDFGPITADSWFFVNTGWSKYWPDKDKYKNLDSEQKINCPKIDIDAAEYLKNKNIKGFGIDTLSPDGNNYAFPVHKIFLEAGIYIIENINFPNNFNKNWGFVFVAPLKVAAATEAPIRLYFC